MEQDSSRQKKILLRGLVVSTAIMALAAKIDQFLTEYFGSSKIAGSKPTFHIDYKALCENSTELEFN